MLRETLLKGGKMNGRKGTSTIDQKAEQARCQNGSAGEKSAVQVYFSVQFMRAILWQFKSLRGSTIFVRNGEKTGTPKSVSGPYIGAQVGLRFWGLGGVFIVRPPTRAPMGPYIISITFGPPAWQPQDRDFLLASPLAEDLPTRPAGSSSLWPLSTPRGPPRSRERWRSCCRVCRSQSRYATEVEPYFLKNRVVTYLCHVSFWQTILPSGRANNESKFSQCSNLSSRQMA